MRIISYVCKSKTINAYMTNILHILHTGLILIFVITATSCSRFSTKRMMEDMMAKPIVMPKMLLKVNKDSINRCTLPASNSFIIFIDSSECKSCVISGLKKYKKNKRTIRSYYIQF